MHNGIYSRKLSITMKKGIFYMFIGIVVGLILSYCYDKREKNNPLIIKESKTVSLDTLKYLVVYSGDTSAYRELSRYYSKTPFPQEMFLYAFIMKYHYGYCEHMEGICDSLLIMREE